jgi:hypothetical protein
MRSSINLDAEFAVPPAFAGALLADLRGLPTAGALVFGFGFASADVFAFAGVLRADPADGFTRMTPRRGS